MRAVACGIVLTCCVGLTGCSLFGKRGQNASNTGNRPSAEPNPAALTAWPGNSGPPGEGAPAPAGVGGILAGQVIDSYNRRPPPTSIQVVSAQETKSAPLDVPTDKNGYFTILGLQPGQRYQLIARARGEGDHLLAGTTWAVAPDARVLIRISEDLATPNTPPLPAAPGWPGSKAAGSDATRSSPAPSTNKAAESNRSSANPANPNAIPRRAAELTPPIKITEVAPSSPTRPAPVPQTRTELRPENVTVRPEGYAQRPPAASVPPWWQATPPPAQAGGAPTAPGASSPLPAMPAPVPSCVLTGQKLHNFALYGLDGQPWELARQRRGRLLLLDFWGPWCFPCLDAIPHLNILQGNYGPQGLEVIGIAYVEGSLQEQVQKIEHVSRMPGKQITYRVLLGGERDSCPVLKQFDIRCWPTLVLLDENGVILWRGEGLDRQNLKELELRIRHKLRGSR